MKIKFKKEYKRCDDGIHPVTYKEGQVVENYEVADLLIQRGIAEEVKPVTASKKVKREKQNLLDD